MRRILGVALALAMIMSMALIASAETGSVEVRGHIVGTDGPVAQYRITYHANGGRGGYNGPNVTAGSADTVCSLSGTGITRSGYRFTVWNTREDGRGISYSAGDVIILNSDVTLYAQWRKTAEGGGGGTRPSGDGWTPPRDGGTTLNNNETTINDGSVPTGDGATALSGGNPNTGAVNGMPLCAGLLGASLGIMVFLLWADRREKQPDTQDP